MGQLGNAQPADVPGYEGLGRDGLLLLMAELDAQIAAMQDEPPVDESLLNEAYASVRQLAELLQKER